MDLRQLHRSRLLPRTSIAGLLLTLSLGCSVPASTKAELTISIASSLSFAFEDLAARFERESGVQVALNVGSSGQLAQQIERGAPADLFASASPSYVDELSAAGRLIDDTRTVFARDQLAFWSLPETPAPSSLADLEPERTGRIAIANPNHAPFGAAARTALTRLFLWEPLRADLVVADNVRHALQYAEMGNVDFAFVSAGLASHTRGQWRVVPDTLYAPVTQTIVVVEGTAALDRARQFISFLSRAEGRAVLADHGLVTD